MRWIIHFLPVVGNRTYRPFARRPWRTTLISFGVHFSQS